MEHVLQSVSVHASVDGFCFCVRFEKREDQYSLPLTAPQVLGSLNFSSVSYTASRLPVNVYLVHRNTSQFRLQQKMLKLLSQVKSMLRGSC